MVGSVERAVVVAEAAHAYNAYEFTVRRNVAILFARIKREGGFDTFALAGIAARRAGGDAIGKHEMRTADRFAAQAVVDSLDAMGDGREAILMMQRIATLLHEVVALVARLPESVRSEAMEETVAQAVARSPVHVARPAATPA